MRIRWPLIFWLLFFAASCLLIWLLSDVVMPFVAGMAIAYFLDPVCDRLERIGLSRLMATWVVTIVCTAILIVVLALVLPAAISQTVDLIERLPNMLESVRIAAEGMLERMDSDVADNLLNQARTALSGAFANLASLLTNAALGLLSGGAAVINLLALAFLTPVVAFFLLRDWDRLIARIDSWLPRPHVPTIRRLAQEVDEILAGWVRGVLIVCISLSIFYAAGLTLVGLPSGLVIGILAGMLSFIPYLGAAIGFLLSVGLAALQFDNWLAIAAVAAIFFVGQAVEGNILTPKLVGDRIGLHPVIVIFAVLAGGALFGFVGVLLALPVAAAVGVLIRFALERYLNSRLYHGDGPDPSVP